MFHWAKSCSYDKDQKRRFHSTARSRVKKLAAELHLAPGSDEIRSNRGWNRCQRRNNLSSRPLLPAGQPVRLVARPWNPDPDLQGRRDFTGGPNHSSDFSCRTTFRALPLRCIPSRESQRQWPYRAETARQVAWQKPLRCHAAAGLTGSMHMTGCDFREGASGHTIIGRLFAIENRDRKALARRDRAHRIALQLRNAGGDLCEDCVRHHAFSNSSTVNSTRNRRSIQNWILPSGLSRRVAGAASRGGGGRERGAVSGKESAARLWLLPFSGEPINVEIPDSNPNRDCRS